MKPIKKQTYYELFEIQPDVGPEAIRQAYELARVTYGDGSLAAYSLFNESERKDLLRRIHLAYETLADEQRRRDYDRTIGLDREPPQTKGNTAPVVDLFHAQDSAPVPPITMREKPHAETLDGSRLRAYRESLKIPLQEIANKTRINITYFEFLETERYHALPPPVYLRGYIKQYAGFLGLDADAVADRIASLVRQDAEPGGEHPS